MKKRLHCLALLGMLVFCSGVIIGMVGRRALPQAQRTAIAATRVPVRGLRTTYPVSSPVLDDPTAEIQKALHDPALARQIKSAAIQKKQHVESLMKAAEYLTDRAEDLDKRAELLAKKGKRNLNDTVSIELAKNLKEQARNTRIEAENIKADAQVARTTAELASVKNDTMQLLLDIKNATNPTKESWRQWLTRKWQEWTGNTQ